jgi:cytidylate kinase
VGFVVAIDGPAASGKGTIAARLGAALGLPVLDSGLLYRAVGVEVLRRAGDLDDPTVATDAAAALVRDLGRDVDRLGDPALRTRTAGEAASRVAAHPAVRAALVESQRSFAAREPGAVLDGRDIGTVIVPHAAAKLYITASAPARAERRWRQLLEAPESDVQPSPDYEDVLADILARDTRDEMRAASPMRPAPDAILLDTTDLDIDAAFDAARRIVEAARG